MKILMEFAHFPVSIPRYFLDAFRRQGHTVYTAGVEFGNWIPWTAENATKEGISLPEKYALKPDVPLEAGRTYAWPEIMRELPEPVDLVLRHAVPASGYSSAIVNRPKGVKYGLLLTDPHVLGWYYKGVRYDADYLFNMQSCYMETGDYYIPYAYDPTVHFYQPSLSMGETDVACVGLQYPNRRVVADELELAGHKVFSKVGYAYDEYRAVYSGAKVGFSWSSKQDTIARVFETPRMATMVCNYTPDLFKFFAPDEVTVFRSGAGEAISLIERLLEESGERALLFEKGLLATQKHTYDHRVGLMEHIICEGVTPGIFNHSLDKLLDGWIEARRAA